MERKSTDGGTIWTRNFSSCYTPLVFLWSRSSSPQPLSLVNVITWSSLPVFASSDVILNHSSCDRSTILKYHISASSSISVQQLHICHASLYISLTVAYRRFQLDNFLKWFCGKMGLMISDLLIVSCHYYPQNPGLDWHHIYPLNQSTLYLLNTIYLCVPYIILATNSECLSTLD
jgi:hypothetical protein